jgi:ABC-type nitrate/sulfonate/bicarbonate transport system substrate-binding protein
MTSRFATRFLLAVAAAALALAAPFAARAQNTDETLSIIAGNPAPGIFDTLEIIADGAGYYKQQRLVVSKDYAANPGTAAQLVATGKADVASLSVEPILLGTEHALHLTAFLSRQARYSYVLAVLADSPIQTLADFKGVTTIGEVNAGSAAEPAISSMLAGVGIRRSEFAYVPTGIGASGLSAFTSHRVVAAAFPFLEIVNDTVAGGVTFRVFRHPILKDVGNVGYASTPATLQTKAEALRRFSRAIVEASLFVRLNPAGAARLYLQGSGQKVTDDALRNTTRVLTLLKDDFPAADPSNKRIGLISPRNMELYSRYLADYGYMKAPVVGSTVATDQFIGYANDFDHKALEKTIMSAR